MIKMLYFGPLREALGCHEESIEWTGGTVNDLLKLLQLRGPDWMMALSTDKIFRVVVNHQVVDNTTTILNNAEVAILPPVTGG